MNTPWHNESVGRNRKGMSLRVEIEVLETFEKRPQERGVLLVWRKERKEWSQSTDGRERRRSE